MKRHIQAATTDRIFHAIDRILVAPLRARLDAQAQELDAQRRDIEEFRDRALAAERAVRDLAESLEPRVVALEEVVFTADLERVEQVTNDLAERTGALGVEAGVTTAAVADLAERIALLEARPAEEPERAGSAPAE